MVGSRDLFVRVRAVGNVVMRTSRYKCCPLSGGSWSLGDCGLCRRTSVSLDLEVWAESAALEKTLSTSSL